MHPRKNDEKRIIHEMAETMRELGEGCTREMLMQRYTQEEVDRYGAPARERANRLAERAA